MTAGAPTEVSADTLEEEGEVAAAVEALAEATTAAAEVPGDMTAGAPTEVLADEDEAGQARADAPAHRAILSHISPTIFNL